MNFRRPAGVRGMATFVALTGLIAVLVPVWLVDRVIARVRTARRRGTTRAIPRITLDDVGPGGLAALMAANEPVVITDLYDRLSFTTAPDLDGLRTVAAEAPPAFTVARHQAHSPYFLYVGDYGAVKDHSVTMTLDEFLDDMFDSSNRDSSDPDSSNSDSSDPDDLCTYKLFAVDALGGRVGDVIDEMASQLETMSGRRPDRRASGLWVGSTGVVTPLHHDAWTGLLFQPVGSKRVAMYAPEDRDNVYLTSPFEPTGRWSALPPRSADADPAEFPRLAHATRWEGRLDPGDTLFIPPYWSHEVEALEPNVSIPFRFATRARDHVNPGFLRPAVEVFHGKYLVASA